MRTIITAYENGQRVGEMDITDSSEHEIHKLKEILQRISRSWKIEERKEAN